MPLQNRVDPFAIIHAVPDRGLLMGNRGGCFHRNDQTLKPTRWASRQWITCVLKFKGRKRRLMQSGLYTELFFLDEVTSLAAGHRPCWECRRADAQAFSDALIKAGTVAERPLVKVFNDAIAGEVQSVLRGDTERANIKPEQLPDGAMFSVNEVAYLRHQGMARKWSFGRYGPAEPLPTWGVRLTPEWSCDALANGYVPILHHSA